MPPNTAPLRGIFDVHWATAIVRAASTTVRRALRLCETAG